MPTIDAKKIRLAANAASLSGPADRLTGLTPAFFRGNDLRVEFALFLGTVLQNTTNIASVTLEVKESDSEFTPPDAGATPVMTKTIIGASLNNALTETNWNNTTDQHGVISFTAAEANITAGPKWLSLWVLTNDSPGRVITVAAGPLRVLEDGSSGSVQSPPAPTSSYYTSTQSDARYLQSSQNLTGLASVSAARANLGLGTAAIVNTGTASGNVPVLDGSGLLPIGVLPPLDVSTLQPRGGVMINGGWMTLPNFVIGRSDFDFLFLIKRESWGTEQYIFSGASSALSLRFGTNDKLRVGVVGVGDLLESTAALTSDAPTWIRLKRSGGTMRLYMNTTEVGNLADALNYTGAINIIGAQDSSGTNSLKATVLAANVWNRGLDDASIAEYKTLGAPELADRWGSMTNIFNATTLNIGKRIYLKTNGTEGVTINGTVYKDGTSGSVDARNGLELLVASANVSANTLTSSSTLRYIGVVWELDLAVGVGYQLHDRSANNLHATLSETGWEHSAKRRDWQLITTLSAAGFIGGSARAMLPPGHIIGNIYTIGGSGITVSLGEAAGGTQLVTSLACNTTVASATLAALRSSNSRVYVNYVSGTGTVTVMMRGIVE